MLMMLSLPPPPPPPSPPTERSVILWFILRLLVSARDSERGRVARAKSYYLRVP